MHLSIVSPTTLPPGLWWGFDFLKILNSHDELSNPLPVYFEKKIILAGGELPVNSRIYERSNAPLVGQLLESNRRLCML